MSAPTIAPTNGTPTLPTQQMPMGIRVITGPGATPITAEQTPARRPERTLEQLLTLAQRSDTARTRQLAEKISGLMEELTGRLEAEREAETRTRELAEKEAALTAELVKVRQRMGTGAEAAMHRAAIRSWAKANGYTVRERGRIPRNVVQAWATATGSEVTR